MPANTTLGWPGSHAMSDAPVDGPIKSVFDHVLPPSVVRYTPRLTLSENGSPSAATSATSGWRGSTRILGIADVWSRPRCFQVFAPSRLRHTPLPYEMSARGL